MHCQQHQLESLPIYLKVAGHHSQFKVPVAVLETSVSLMRMNSASVELTIKAKILILNEATIALNDAISYINRQFQWIMQNNNSLAEKFSFLVYILDELYLSYTMKGDQLF